MKEIRILHLFPQLLSLYGEYGNVAILAKTLRDQGYALRVDTYEEGTPDLNADFLFIGSGTEGNLLEAAKRLLPHRQAIQASVESGACWLATGNAMTLFGREITYNGQCQEGLGVFPYTTEMLRDRRFLGDAMTADGYVGFVNTSGIYRGITDPFLTLVLGEKLGNTKEDGLDGIHQKNFYATQLIGPFLVKNPQFLAQIFTLLTGSPLDIPADAPIRLAHGVAVTELTKRLAKN